jgi:hypothetical protein
VTQGSAPYVWRGRPDLADPVLGWVRAPTPLIGGGHDDVVLGLNRRAQAWLNCENDAFTQVLAAGIELRLVVRDESSAGY